MEHPDPILPSPAGFKRFFSTDLLDSSELSVRGIGVRERMPACMIERPRGTSDFLFMLFHDPAVAGTSSSEGSLEKPDTMMIWPPGKAQYYGNREHKFNHSWIHCEGKRIQRILHGVTIPLLKPFVLPSPSRFQQCLLEMHGELVSYRHPDPVIIGNLLENCLHAISRKLAESDENAHVREKLLSVRQMIATVPSRMITLEEMAALAGFSVSYFCSQFKNAFGVPPMECLGQHRLHRAAHLLADRNLTVSEIASQTGYGDPFHFSKMFKKQFGVGPREMRKRQISAA